MSYSVFLDFDGTLKVPGAAKMSKRVIQSLSEAQKKGHKIFLNTGRTYAYLDFDAFDGFCFDGYLCGCSYIKVNEKVLLADRMTPAEMKPIITHFQNRGVILLLEGEDAMWAAFDTEGVTKKEGMIPLTDMKEIFRICEKEAITKMNVLINLGEEDLAFVRRFADPIERDDTTCTEIVRKGNSKAYVMEKAIEFLNLDPQKVIAMGDSSNDFAMLDAAPISVAMGNASDEVKRRAKYVTATDKEDGVAVFLEEFLQ